MFAGRGFSIPPPGFYDAFVYKGAIDCSTNPNYPAADAGHVYKVSVAGKIGGASGAVVTANDNLICTTDGSPGGTQAAVGGNWNIIEGNIDWTAPPAIGTVTPAYGRFSPSVSQGPAIITSFAGTVSTSGSSTTVTFSSAADAILAGYSATAPVLGTTLITAGPFTRYIVSWTNATTCVVDTAVTLGAGTAITSVQLPIATFVNSAGVTQGWLSALGRLILNGQDGSGHTTIDFGKPSSGTYRTKMISKENAANAFTLTSLGFGDIIALYGYNTSIGNATGNILTGGLTAAGTSAVKVLAMANGTAPTTSPADAVQIWSGDINAEAGKSGAHIRNENTTTGGAVVGAFIKADTGDYAAGASYEGMMVINTADNTLKVYAEAGWRQIATW